MVNVYSFNGLVPVVHPDAYVHPSAVLIGDVHVGPRCYIGPCASLRGDFGRIVVKAGSNVQDGCVVHGGSKQDAIIEENGHIGHCAVIHGCHIAMQVPPRVMVAGNPAKVVRDLTEKEVTNRIAANLNYQRLAARSLAVMQEATALPAAEPGRRRMQMDGTAITDEKFNEITRASRAARGLPV